MQTITTLSSRLAAAATALALSLVLISGTVATPSNPHSSSAYVGAIA